MINNNPSTVRKFEFFEEVKSESSIKEETIISHEDSPLENTPITLNDLKPKSIDQMCAIDDIIFINGKAIHKIQGTLARESIIMKIYNNKVVDSYRMFNGVYYYFKIQYFFERPLFVTVGGNFDKYISKKREEQFMYTSIKIYNLKPLLNKDENIYPVPNNLKPTEEQYPKLLLRQIRILKNIQTEELLCDIEGNKMEGYESFQNIVIIAVNSTFTHISIGLEKGDILLISAYPNILDCAEKDFKIRFLPKIFPKDREIHITNLEFSEMIINNEPKRILYVSTANAVYYYEWNYEDKRGSNAENNIELKELLQDEKGAYTSCICVKDNLMLLASSNNDFIIEYENLEFGKTWFFEGNKSCLKYFKDNYFIFVINGDKSSEIQIYDKLNKFFICNICEKKNIIGICCDNDFIYILYGNEGEKKSIIKLKEKENKDKFEIFYSKNQYEIALSYAEKSGFDNKKLSEIIKKYAEYEYSKGDFESSISLYIKTINYLEPSLVIQKFLEKSKLDYLIQYLEALDKNEEFQSKGDINTKNYTTLLLNCYIMQEKIPKLEEFMYSKGNNFPIEIIKTAIDVCLETQNIELALSIAKQKKLYEEYLQILILKLNQLEEALDFICPPDLNAENNNNNDNNSKENMEIKDQINLMNKFGEYFLRSNEEKIPELFFKRIINFIEKNMNILSKNEIIKLTEIFIITDKYFKILFEKMELYGIEFNKEVIHRRIELYLEEKKDDNDNDKKVMEMLGDDKFKDKYDIQYLIMLFKFKEFKQGIEALSKIINKKHELLNIYMLQKNYEKIIHMCDELNDSGISAAGIILNYFLDKKLREKMNKEELEDINKYLKKFLLKILDENLIFPISILNIINEKNNELPIDIINFFIEKSIEKQFDNLKLSSDNITNITKKINDLSIEMTKLNTNAIEFKLEKCDKCKVEMSFPCLRYTCGHIYHSICLNANIGDDVSNIHCPVCKKDKDKINEELNNIGNYYKFIKEKKNFEEEYKKSENKIDFVLSLYGKGLFDNKNDL